jgi:hypothetical protein
MKAIARAPVTSLLLGQYVALVLIPAIRFDRDSLGFILGVVLTGVLTSGIVEAVLFPLGNLGGERKRVSLQAAIALTAIGLLAIGAASSLGAGTYESQVHGRPPNPLSAFFTPFEIWALLGPLIGFYGVREGHVRRFHALGLASASSCFILGLGLYQALLARAMSYFLALALCAVLASVVKPHWIVAGILAVALAWPTLNELRNETRLRTGVAAEIVQSQTASERLQLNANLALAANIDVPADIGQPGFADVIRRGLVPRVLDPGRPAVSTGTLLNAALGGTTISSFGFTILGNAYVLSGWDGLVLYIALASLGIGILVRRRGILAFLLVGVLVRDCLWIEASYPDGVAGFLQDAVSAAMALGAIQLARSVGRFPYPASEGA